MSFEMLFHFQVLVGDRPYLLNLEIASWIDVRLSVYILDGSRGQSCLKVAFAAMTQGPYARATRL